MDSLSRITFPLSAAEPRFIKFYFVSIPKLITFTHTCYLQYTSKVAIIPNKILFPALLNK